MTYSIGRAASPLTLVWWHRNRNHTFINTLPFVLLLLVLFLLLILLLLLLLFVLLVLLVLLVPSCSLPPTPYSLRLLLLVSPITLIIFIPTLTLTFSLPFLPVFPVPCTALFFHAFFSFSRHLRHLRHFHPHAHLSLSQLPPQPLWTLTFLSLLL